VLRKRRITPTWLSPAPPGATERVIWRALQPAPAAWAVTAPLLADVVVERVVEVDVVAEDDAGVVVEDEADVVVEDEVDAEPQPASAVIPARQTSARLTCRLRSSAARDSAASG
jgi:hypothetical protein